MIDKINLDKVAIVVRSFNNKQLNDFIKNWNIPDYMQKNIFLYVESDFDAFQYENKINAFSREDIRLEMGDRDYLFPKGSLNIKCFLYYKVYKTNRYDYVLSLDITSSPEKNQNIESLISSHIVYIENRTKWANSYNSLIKARGVPFYNLGNNFSVIANHGLTFEGDSNPVELFNSKNNNVELSYDNKILSSHCYYPLNESNLMFKTQYSVLFYYPPENSSYKNYQDIWFGLILQKCCSLLNLSLSNGMPYCHIENVKNPFHFMKESLDSFSFNEYFWKYVDDFIPSNSLNKQNKFVVYKEFGNHFIDVAEKIDCEYLSLVGKSMVDWFHLFYKE